MTKMLSTQMEEHKECDTMGSPLQGGIHIRRLPSPHEIEKVEARKRIIKDIDQRKEDELKINKKLLWFTRCDQYIKWKTEEIQNLEPYLGKVDQPNLPTNSVPRTRKRYQKRLMKKGRKDMDYLQQVHEDVFVKESGRMTSIGIQEVNDLIESMAQRIQHGNKNRVDEMRIYSEMRNFKVTREMYMAPEPDPPSNWDTTVIRCKHDADWKRAIQHKIKIRLDDIEDVNMLLKGRTARVARLKSELGFVRKSIGCLQKKLEDVNKKMIKA